MGLPESAVETYTAHSKENTPPPRAVQLNKVYQPQGRLMLNSNVTSRLINAVRYVAPLMLDERWLENAPAPDQNGARMK
jgi:hypothetical protein